jgi:chemotaxis family two-component system response regulator Rcp1
VLRVREALNITKLHIRLKVVEDGVKAIAYLRKQGDFQDARTPDLVLLDLDFPSRPGKELLAAIKSDPVLKSLPVVVFSSAAAQACRAAYDSHANCCVQKPRDYDTFSSTVNQICDFWFSVAVLPRHAS